MATDTVPAAVPGPDDRPQGTPEPGLLASMLAPVDPARPAFNLAPATAAGETAATAVTGVSSADYHAADSTPAKAAATSAARQQQSVMRAWLLAGAERWKKGGDARNKRLDLAKTKAQARQVKETRQVTVNRSGGMLPKGPSSAGSAGKSSGSKANSAGSVKGPKNSARGPQRGPGGRSVGPAGSASGAGLGPASKDSSAHGGTRPPKQPKAGLSKGSTSGGASDRGPVGGKTGAKGSAGGADKTGTSAPAGKGPGAADGAKSSKRPDSKDSTAGKDGQKPNSAGKDADTKGGPGTAGSTGKNSAPAPATGQSSKGTKPAPAKDTKPAQQDGRPFTTRESREAGYRDGTRAARTVAHVKAYGDGVKDGWTDTTEAADRDKARLDEAHEARKTARDKEQPVTGTTSSADYHQAQPIGVRDVNSTHVRLGDGADKFFVSRGEVRSLKGFERRLREKADAMTRIADGTKALKAHADDQAIRATRLVEAARSVKGGDKLAASLAKLEEAARVQSGKAEEIHKRAVRAAEACAVVLANVETRYGGIYQAVVDSDETTPAELDFYKD